MVKLYKKPSRIRYSQDSISNTFIDGRPIGNTLRDLNDCNISVEDIPTIKVAKVGKRWYTSDNRRLWVFKKLEKRGMCDDIPVRVIDEIPSHKMTTTTEGRTVRVRGGGVYTTDDSDSDSDSDSVTSPPPRLDFYSVTVTSPPQRPDDDNSDGAFCRRLFCCRFLCCKFICCRFRKESS